MNTPTSSGISISNQSGSLQSMLLELDRKIGEISDLKDQITQRMSLQEQESAQKELFKKNHSLEALINKEMEDFVLVYKNNFASSIKQELQTYGNEQISITIQIAKQYQKQSNLMKKYYEQEINELKQQIQRQYKVMARMKQEVQDLVVLMKCKQNAQIHECCGNQNQEGTSMNEQKVSSLKLSGIGIREFDNELDVIEEETERTLQSSQRSRTIQSQFKEQTINYIRIQQKHSQDGSNSKPYSGIQLNDEVQDFQRQAQIQPQFPLVVVENQCYEDFCEDLTPKQSEQAVELPKYSQNQNNDEQCLFGFDSSEKNSEIKYKILPNKGRKQRPNTSFGNQNKRNDHHESIFFLDEQPQYINKTQLKKIQKSKSSELTKPAPNQRKNPNSFLFFKERNEGSITEEQISRHGSQESKNREQSDGSFVADHADNYSSEKMQYYLEGYETLKSKFHKQQQIENSYKSEEATNEKKNTTKINYFNNQQTNQEIFKKFSKIMPAGQLGNSSSIPVSYFGQPLGEISPNFCQKSIRSSIESKPKTKQFLDQFKKTFNKCLNSMQISKKNSTKIINNSAKQKNKANQEGSRPSGVMAFGKNNSNQRLSSHSPLSKDTKDQQNLNFRAKKQDNRFMTGNRKLQVKYEGDKKNGTRDGNGVLFYSNGLCYEGQFKNGLRHGFGVLKINHIDIYNGDWINDEIQGSGKIRNCAIINKRKTINSNHGTLGKWISYHGEFKDSLFDGQGTLCLQGGERYVGNFRNGCAFGKGSLFRKNGEVEQGIWLNGGVTIGQ